MRKSANLLVILALLPLLAGCPHIDTLRVTPDRPEDLEALLKQNEFARIQGLLERHTELDTAGLQTVLDSHIGAYEDNTLADARTRESEGDLRAAIARLDDALSRLPSSTRLDDYKTALEARRTERLQETGRRELLARARYLVELRQLQHEKLQLESPGIAERWKHSTSQQEAGALGAELLACGQRALQQDELGSASACLRMAETLNNGPEVQSALAELASRSDSTRRVQDVPAPARSVRQANTGRQQSGQQNSRQQLLAQTEQALQQNDLVTARKTFHELEEKTGASNEIDAVKKRLEAAVKASVDGLTRQGDSLYRAEKVNEAITSWNHALELDPDNVNLHKRLARARKVLARLEELKSRQTTSP
ncbi:MAG: tetratricopeptide repeat protein [Gammaproteobacteria bacterium]|nr:tetratricopeptide repeat protein [Gammaproteobacteria bacterium]